MLWSKELHSSLSIKKKKGYHSKFFCYDDNVNSTMFRFTSSASVGEPSLSFDEKTWQLFSQLSQNASVNHNMFASGEIGVYNWKIYGFAQCTRDLSVNECKRCLGQTIESALNCCSRRRGVRIVSSSFIRYELYPFLNISCSQ